MLGYIFVCIQVSYVLPLFVCFVNNVNNVLAIGNSRIAYILQAGREQTAPHPRNQPNSADLLMNMVTLIGIGSNDHE